MKKTTLIFTACLLALFTACGNHFNPLNDIHSAESFGKVSLSINSAGMKYTQAARTVNPSLDDDPFSDFAMLYEFAKVTKDWNNNEIIDAWTAKTPDADGLFTLTHGSWQVKVSAYAQEGDTAPVADGTSETFTIDSFSTTVVVMVWLTEDDSAYTEGTGTFSYHVKYTEGADVVTFMLKNMDENDDAPFIVDLHRVSPTRGSAFDTLRGSVPGVPAGYYYLTVLLTKAGDFAGANEVVYIYNGMTSEYGTADEPVVFTFDYFSDYDPYNPSGTIYTVEEIGDGNPKKTNAIKFTFKSPVSGLTAANITVTHRPGDAEGEVTTGAVTGSGTEWYLAITDVLKPGYIYVRVNKRGIEDEEKIVAVVWDGYNPGPTVTVDAVYAQRGVLYSDTPMDNLKNTLMVKLLYDGLSPQMLSRSEYSLIPPAIPLPVGEITVGVNAQGFLGSFKPIIAARYTPTASATLPNNGTTTGITLTFDADIDALGLSADALFPRAR